MTIESVNTLKRSLRRTLLAGTGAVIALLASLGCWLTFTELSEAVIAPGTIVVDGNLKSVQHPAGGTVAELLVREGQSVRAGEPLLKLDTTVASANLSAIAKNINQLIVREARLKAERDGLADVAAPPELLARVSRQDIDDTLVSERRLFLDRREARAGEKAGLQEQIRQTLNEIDGLVVQGEAKDREIVLINQELVGQRTLFEQGLTSVARMNGLDRNAARLDGERGQVSARAAAAKAKIAELQIELLQVDNRMRADVAKELRDVGNERARLAKDEVKALDEVQRSEIRAPIAGVVHQLAVHTIGGVVTSADTLMRVVPSQSDLTVEVRVAPSEIDRVALEQRTRLRLTAFNRNTTPELQGTVKRISADLEIDERQGVGYYKVGISIPPDQLLQVSDLKLVPGMPAEAFILTGERTMLSYFTKPLFDHAQRSFREN